MITGVTRSDPSKALRRKRTASFGLAILTLSVSTAVGMSACADPEATFYVATPVVAATAECSPDQGLVIKCGSDQQAAATVYTCLDCAGNLIQNPYACFEIRSELATTAVNGTMEKRTIVLQSVDATLDIGGSSVSGHFPASGAIEPSASGTPVAIQAAIPLVSADNLNAFYAAGIAKQATIVVYGRTTGGLDVQTPPYTFAATVNELKMKCN